MAHDHIIINRVDNIGDVLLTLPLAGLIKEYRPQVKITFLGKSYTAPLLKSCDHIDHILYWDQIALKSRAEQVKSFRRHGADTILQVYPHKAIAQIAYKAGIPLRVGTWRRWYHLIYCNKWIHLKRKGSFWHESQLNLQLAKPLNIPTDWSLPELAKKSGFRNIYDIPPRIGNTMKTGKFSLIIHPKTKGNAQEWSWDNYNDLLSLLPEDDFEIYITGTEKDGQQFRPALNIGKSNVQDLSGQLSLEHLIAFIDEADALLAPSTGPLHIAGLLGLPAIGLFAPRRPVHPGRWRPLGTQTKVFVLDEACNRCKSGTYCGCINSITPAEIKEYLMEIKSF